MEAQTLPTKLQGEIKRFKGNGRMLGYPTANIDIATQLKDGIYFGYAGLGEYTDWPCLVFIGTPTTVGDTERRVEAHLLDVPDIDYYGLELTLYLIYYHRPNQTFNTLPKLQEAIKHDEADAREWFKRRD